MFLLATSALPILFFLPSNTALAVPSFFYSFIFMGLEFIGYARELISSNSVTHF
ncbi:hypothetical protein HPTD01_786 [Halomonas sp. TD01]|nr:hypothetical protein HPTD01_786 [Halomonas sp. TD01]